MNKIQFTEDEIEQIIKNKSIELYRVGVDKRMKSYICENLESAIAHLCMLLQQEDYGTNIYIHKTLNEKATYEQFKKALEVQNDNL
jgi:hypothetical protein